jgi:hypothetical protein
MRFSRLLFAFLVPMPLFACGSAPDAGPADVPAPAASASAPVIEPGEPVVPFTAEDVQSLFDRRCTQCHDDDHVLDLSRDFAKATVGVRARSESCSKTRFAKLIVAGDRSASLLYQKVAGTADCGKPMPYRASDPKLTATEIERLGLYIDELR